MLRTPWLLLIACHPSAALRGKLSQVIFFIVMIVLAILLKQGIVLGYYSNLVFCFPESSYPTNGHESMTLADKCDLRIEMPK